MKRYNLTSANSTNATSVKAAAAVIRRIVVENTTTAARFLKIYNKASAPTVGTDVPVQIITVPAKGKVNVLCLGPGLVLGTGLALATTANEVNTDNTAVAAGALVIDISYN